MINPNEPYCSIYNEVTSSTRATKLKGSEPVIVDYVALDAKNKKHPQKVMNVILSGLYLLYEIDDKGFFLVFFLFFIYNNYPQQRTQREREKNISKRDPSHSKKPRKQGGKCRRNTQDPCTSCSLKEKRKLKKEKKRRGNKKSDALVLVSLHHQAFFLYISIC